MSGYAVSRDLQQSGCTIPTGPQRMRRAVVPTLGCILVLWSCGYAFAQTEPPASTPGMVPETAFISPTKYTNAFFGFSLTLPRGIPFQQMSVPTKDPSVGFLFGVQDAEIKGTF